MTKLIITWYDQDLETHTHEQLFEDMGPSEVLSRIGLSGMLSQFPAIDEIRIFDYSK